MSTPVITVDGPSGVGKGTISHLLASHFGFHFLDSGALYRLTALAALRHGVDLGDEFAVATIAASLDVAFHHDASGEVRVMLENLDVSLDIRTEQAGNNASKVAVLPAVRAALLQRQRDFAEAPGLVADGRDMGTTVFPLAAVKLFLTASAEARAERRYQQLAESSLLESRVQDSRSQDSGPQDKQLPGQGESDSLRALLADIQARDLRDSQRASSPLKPAEDALVLDSTNLSINQVVDTAFAFIKDKGIGPANPSIGI